MFVSPFVGLDIPDLIRQSFDAKEQDILKLNKDQMDGGIKADGSEIGRYRNYKYKNRFKPVDLKLKNDFRGDMFFRDKGNKRQGVISSDDKKTIKLEKKYGKDIFGLTDTNKQYAADLIKPILGRLIKEKTIGK